MFSKITWQEFIGTIVIMGLCYYIVVLVVYYRKDILYLIRNGFQRKVMQPTPPTHSAPNLVKDQQPSNDGADNNLLYTSVHDLLEELKNVFAQAADKGFPKQELIVALQVVLKKYSSLKGTAYQVAINNQIEIQAKDDCNIEIEDADLKRIWG